jgi:hypothetical protein
MGQSANYRGAELRRGAVTNCTTMVVREKALDHAKF